jgi:hypothetical protein
VVERRSFQDLLQLVNEDAMLLVSNTSRSGLATHLGRVYFQCQEEMKLEFLAKQNSICFTQDAWTAPNYTAYMAVTAHFITLNFDMRDIKLAITHVQGESLHVLHSTLYFT